MELVDVSSIGKTNSRGNEARASSANGRFIRIKVRASTRFENSMLYLPFERT